MYNTKPKEKNGTTSKYVTPTKQAKMQLEYIWGANNADIHKKYLLCVCDTLMKQHTHTRINSGK